MAAWNWQKSGSNWWSFNRGSWCARVWSDDDWWHGGDWWSGAGASQQWWANPWVAADAWSGTRSTEEDAVDHILDQMAALSPTFQVWRKVRGKTQRTRAIPVPQPAQILPTLFLGDADDLFQCNKHKACGVTGIVSCCPEHLTGDMLSKVQESGLEHLVVNADDDHKFDIVKCFRESCLPFIKNT